MAGKRDIFPVYRVTVGQVRPGDVKERTFFPNGQDGMTGPSYSGRRRNADVSGTTKPVQRYGVQAGNRREWKR